MVVRSLTHRPKLFGPRRLRSPGDLNLGLCASLSHLPAGLTVEGDLNLTGCEALTHLPAGLVVGGHLGLRRCTALTHLPADLRVGRDLDLRGCTALARLPYDVVRWEARADGSPHDIIFSTSCTGAGMRPEVARSLQRAAGRGVSLRPIYEGAVPRPVHDRENVMRSDWIASAGDSLIKIRQALPAYRKVKKSSLRELKRHLLALKQRTDAAQAAAEAAQLSQLQVVLRDAPAVSGPPAEVRGLVSWLINEAPNSDLGRQLQILQRRGRRFTLPAVFGAARALGVSRYAAGTSRRLTLPAVLGAARALGVSRYAASTAFDSPLQKRRIAQLTAFERAHIDPLQRIRGNTAATEIDNAIRTFSGRICPSDRGLPICATSELSDVCALVWYAIASYAQGPDATCTKAKALMRDNFVMSMAQCIEDDSHRVCGIGQRARFARVLQGYYADVAVDRYLTPAILLNSLGKEFHEHAGSTPSPAQLDEFYRLAQTRAAAEFAEDSYAQTQFKVDLRETLRLTYSWEPAANSQCPKRAPPQAALPSAPKA